MHALTATPTTEDKDASERKNTHDKLQRQFIRKISDKSNYKTKSYDIRSLTYSNNAQKPYDLLSCCKNSLHVALKNAGIYCVYFLRCDHDCANSSLPYYF